MATKTKKTKAPASKPKAKKASAPAKKAAPKAAKVAAPKKSAASEKKAASAPKAVAKGSKSTNQDVLKAGLAAVGVGSAGGAAKKAQQRAAYLEDPDEIDRDKLEFAEDEEGEGLEGAAEVEEEEFDEDNEGLPGWWKNDPRGIEAEEEGEGEKADFDDSDEWTEDDDWNDGDDNKDNY